MICLTCENNFEQHRRDDFDCFVCSDCALIWFSQGQLKRARILGEAFGKFLTGLELQQKPNSSALVHCPSCNIPFHRHSYPMAPHVKIAECYGCGGSLLSVEQILDIRENSMNVQQLEAYREQLAHSVPGYTQAEHQRVQREGLGKFARAWKKYRFWARDKDA